MFGQDSEPVTLKRDCQVNVVPAGFQVTLEKGSLVYITQAMGGSFTIYFEGNLYRVAGSDADALGKEPIKPPELPEGATDEEFETLVWDQMRTIFDPEIPINIVDLGLIYEVEVGDGHIGIVMTLTTPGCPLHASFKNAIETTLWRTFPGLEDVTVELVWTPPWTPERITATGRAELGLT